ncbi:MAG: hypothetical protein ACRDE8_10190 [Ginsengibacter sp.]
MHTYKILKLLPGNKFLLVVCMLCLSLTSKSQQSALVAVGNVSGVPSDMQLSELRAVFMGEKQRWKNGDRILIALMKTNTPLGKITSAKIYDMNGDELNKFWLALVFQGKAQAPKFFNSENELADFVAQNPGAIGILDKPIPGSDIKFINIDGQKTF